ncbi:hypothetical protein B0J17DRAFT_631336 [Rhizoctonia solani]|nr:hypothetical protein B0J17DRAFT_631336 [Rhizoctonia solani]
MDEEALEFLDKFFRCKGTVKPSRFGVDLGVQDLVICILVLGVGAFDFGPDGLGLDAITLDTAGGGGLCKTAPQWDPTEIQLTRCVSGRAGVSSGLDSTEDGFDQLGAENNEREVQDEQSLAGMPGSIGSAKYGIPVGTLGNMRPEALGGLLGRQDKNDLEAGDITPSVP